MSDATVAQLVRSSMARRARKRQVEIATRTGGQTDSKHFTAKLAKTATYTLAG